jgi:hypothetical protein
MTRRTALGCLSGLAVSGLARAQAVSTKDQPTVLRAGGAAIEVTFSSDQFDLPRPALLAWIDTGARAVSAYFGRFPVSHARVQVVMAPGRRRVSGVTWGDGGAHSRITVAQHATEQDLQHDWVMTHEMVHYGFPSVDAEHHWMEEGSATYIEPIARAAVGNLPVAQVWGDMVRDMPQGLPGAGDQGLDHTHSWGRTYWGGALFCLLADVGIRRRSRNQKGLVDALRAVNRAGGNIANDWPLEHALQVGDKATGGQVLTTLYGQMAAQPMPVDLPEIWRQLGVKREGGQVTFDAAAPLAGVRAAIC